METENLAASSCSCSRTSVMTQKTKLVRVVGTGALACSRQVRLPGTFALHRRLDKLPDRQAARVGAEVVRAPR
jgi:hypothetical protein